MNEIIKKTLYKNIYFNFIILIFTKNWIIYILYIYIYMINYLSFKILYSDFS